MDPDLFTGYDGEATIDRVFREQEAQSVCRRCVLIDKCLEWAMEYRERGVWGGLTEDDRRALRYGRTPPSKRDPEGKTKQQRAREDRVKIAKNLISQGLDYEAISKEIGVTLGTIYDYFRGDPDHGEANPRSETEAEETSEGSRSPDTERQADAVLKEDGS